MRIPCPLCGDRDLREFTYLGHETYLARPEPGDAAALDEYLHLRDNAAGEIGEMWFHGMGCGAWLHVVRNTVTHDISQVTTASGTAFHEA